MCEINGSFYVDIQCFELSVTLVRPMSW